MKCLPAAILFIASGFFVVESARAQEHGEVGVFADYFRFSDPKNFGGLGARVSIGVESHTQLEAEMAYDFERPFTESFTNPATNAIFFQRSQASVLHAMFGPEFHTTGDAPAVGFITIKGGFINFRFDDRPATFGNLFGSFDDVRDTWKGTLYPAAGVKGFIGPVGLRLEVGDEIYFMDGARNNLRVTFGPSLRF